jgi:hypothetical protein
MPLWLRFGPSGTEAGGGEELEGARSMPLADELVTDVVQ